MSELTIHPIKKQKCAYKGKKVNKILPQPNTGVVTLIGNTCCGKSSIIINCVYKWYNKYYEEGSIYFISPTCEADDNTWMLLEDPHITCISDIIILDETLNKIIDKQYEDLERGELSPAWIICDDCLGLGLHTSKALEKIASKGRHILTTLWITSQNYKKLSPTLRYNTSYFIISKLNSKREVTLIDEELNGLFPDFLKYYHEATKEPYQFLYANMKRRELRKSFGKILYKPTHSKDE